MPQLISPLFSNPTYTCFLKNFFITCWNRSLTLKVLSDILVLRALLELTWLHHTGLIFSSKTCLLLQNYAPLLLSTYCATKIFWKHISSESKECHWFVANSTLNLFLPHPWLPPLSEPLQLCIYETAVTVKQGQEYGMQLSEID